MEPENNINQEAREPGTEVAGNSKTSGMHPETGGQDAMPIHEEQHTEDPCKQGDANEMKPEEPAPEDLPVVDEQPRLRMQPVGMVPQAAAQMPQVEAALDFDDEEFLENFLNQFLLEEDDYGFDVLMNALFDPRQLVENIHFVHFVMALISFVIFSLIIFKGCVKWML